MFTRSLRVPALIILLLAIVAVCLFESALHGQSGAFREFEAVLVSVPWMLLVCVAVWCVFFLFLTFSRRDLPLIGLVLIAITAYFAGYAASRPAMNAVTLLAGVTLGKGAHVVLGRSSQIPLREGETLSNRDSIAWDKVTARRSLALPSLNLSSKPKPSAIFDLNSCAALGGVYHFLVGLVLLLAFSSWWHLDLAGGYHGPRWMGLWNNPNIYGMLMAAGLVLAVGLLTLIRSHPTGEGTAHSVAHRTAAPDASARRPYLDSYVLLLAAVMMGTGLVCSYSRGSWLGAAVGLLALAKARGKLNWRFVLLAIFVIALVAGHFWSSTPDNAPWYVKRMDLGRPSAQHRVAAWRGALLMMRDHPWGVGWNKAVGLYQRNYSPPQDGASAMHMNSYLMLGTELGWPGLLCFLAYVALRLRGGRASRLPSEHMSEGLPSAFPTQPGVMPALPSVCRAGALTLLVAFWFDGGLFNLPTAATFWILLELGGSGKSRHIRAFLSCTSR